MNPPRASALATELAAAVAAVLVIVHWHLVPALLGGLIAFIVSRDVQAYARRREHRWPKPVTFTLAGIAALAAIGALIAGVFVAVRNADIAGLSASVVRGLEAFHNLLPSFLQEMLPGDAEQIRSSLSELLGAQSEALRGAGLGVLHGAVHALLGSVIGVMLSFEGRAAHPLARRIAVAADGLVRAFRGVMVAQAKISAINAVLTGVFLLGVMPLIGFPLPLSKTLVALTFIAGLMPVLGNLVSNAAITLVALLVAPTAAIVALLFLVVVHKLEYFLNARIVGGEVGARAWELLLAMLVAEACFGVSGLILAPVVYVWLRDMVAAQTAP